MKVFSRVSGLFRKSNENAPGALDNTIHPEKKRPPLQFKTNKHGAKCKNKKIDPPSSAF